MKRLAIYTEFCQKKRAVRPHAKRCVVFCCFQSSSTECVDCLDDEFCLSSTNDEARAGLRYLSVLLTVHVQVEIYLESLEPTVQRAKVMHAVGSTSPGALKQESLHALGALCVHHLSSRLEYVSRRLEYVSRHVRYVRAVSVTIPFEIEAFCPFWRPQRAR
eukprot:1795954-Pleurochrysis_carterae.AAC.1